MKELINEKYEVKLEQNKVNVYTTTTGSMDIKDAVTEIQNLEQQIQQINANLNKLNKDIEDKVWEKQKENLERNKLALLDIFNQFQKVISPQVEELKSKIKAEIKKIKAEKGYDRIGDKNSKVTMSSLIVSEVCSKYDIEAGHPISRELRVEFDKI